MREQIITGDAPTPAGAYSQAIAAGPLLCTAGVGGHDPRTGTLAGSTVEQQTAQAMRNLRSVLAAAGLSLGDVVKVTVHLADLHRDFAAYDAAYQQFVEPPYPARTTVGSTLGPGMLVEIDALAVRPEA
jgi:2-iminobutanoate/2-iminopropanoate deaminase